MTKTQTGYTVKFNKETSSLWSRDPAVNAMTILCKRDLMRDKLMKRGYLFLNEVLEAFGLPPVREGQFAGWVWRKTWPGPREANFQIFNVEADPNGLDDLLSCEKTETTFYFNCIDNIHDLIWDDK